MKSGDRDRTGTVQGGTGKNDALELELESTSSQTMRGVRLPKGFGSSGYNPYDTVPGATSATGMHKMNDMRRLSEWIRMKRDLALKDKD